MNEGEEFCFDCVRHKRSFEFGRALLNYDDVSGPSMARIKYHNKREYLDFYSQVMAARYETIISRMNADALIPIPIHRARYRKRGFNQAQVLAEKLGELLGIPVCPRALKRRKKTDPQKDLTAAQRLKNLEEAFEVGELPAGVRTVILIDDIYTTGSTIEACTRVLKKAGISQVYFLTICIGHNTG